MVSNSYSSDINLIDRELSSHLASAVGNKEFDKIRKEFLEGFEIGWKFTKAEAGNPKSKFYERLLDGEVIKMVEYELKRNPRDCGMAFGIVVSSLRNNPSYIFTMPESLRIYLHFFEAVAGKRADFKKFLYEVAAELKRTSNYTIREWNGGQKGEYLAFLASLMQIVG